MTENYNTILIRNMQTSSNINWSQRKLYMLHFPVYTSDVFPHLSPTELSMLPLLFYFWQLMTAQYSSHDFESHEGRTILAALMFVDNWSGRKVWGCSMTWCSALLNNQHSQIIRNDCLNCPVCMQVCLKQSWDFLITFLFLKNFFTFLKTNWLLCES